MPIPTMTIAGLQQSGGAEQTVTTAGMVAWIGLVNGYRTGFRGKRQLFTASREEVIRTSRRDND